MSKLIETKENYYQAIGVLRGTPKADLPAKGKNRIFSLLYHGREYPILPSRARFEQYKDFDLDKERLFLVYPRPRAFKPYHLLKKDYGQARALTLSFTPNGIHALYNENGWGRNYIDTKSPQLMVAGNLERLFSVTNQAPGLEDSRLAYSVFKLLKGVLHYKNEAVGDGERKIARQTLVLLNKALCDQLYHPGAEDPSGAFMRGWIQSSCLNTELDRWAKGMLFDTMSFVLVAYSDAEGDDYLDTANHPLGQPMSDGEFILSGHWERWKGMPLLDNNGEPLLDFKGGSVYAPMEKRPTKATFTSHLNRKSERDFKHTPLGAEDPKKMIIFLDRDEPEVKGKCWGRAIAQFSPKLNVFNPKAFIETEAFPAPLTSKNLAAKKKAAKSSTEDCKQLKQRPKTKKL